MLETAKSLLFHLNSVNVLEAKIYVTRIGVSHDTVIQIRCLGILTSTVSLWGRNIMFHGKGLVTP